MEVKMKSDSKVVMREAHYLLLPNSCFLVHIRSSKDPKLNEQKMIR